MADTDSANVMFFGSVIVKINPDKYDLCVEIGPDRPTRRAMHDGSATGKAQWSLPEQIAASGMCCSTDCSKCLQAHGAPARAFDHSEWLKLEATCRQCWLIGPDLIEQM